MPGPETEPDAPAARVHPRRWYVGQVLTAVGMVAALVLVAAALLLVVQAEDDHAVVAFVRGAADVLDLGVFDVDGTRIRFEGQRADLKDAMVNYGIAALVWMLVGRVGGRLVGGPTPTCRDRDDE